ncbi:MAG: hypothetical protein EO766_12160 [Hydrotalea sp. AMD]|uniref:hypothetical protein n=1 Tax=Hydrotalea sp. AMD TaxID=2501297 RepID=UPI001024FCE7|nr:hypothetical protein [Hydrotalea sp. AMD]RWZ87271.1 MAG: hypothetical protein EO766_12160 [Hydrotalea sp. AMD]
MPILPNDDIILHGVILFHSDNETKSDLIEFTTTPIKISLAHFYYLDQHIGLDVINKLETSETEGEMLFGIMTEWKHDDRQKFFDLFNAQYGWCGFETTYFSVCIALTPEMAKDGFETLYSY